MSEFMWKQLQNEKKNSHFNKYLIWQADPREDSEPQTLNQGLASLAAPPCEPAHPLPGPISPHRPLSLGYSTYQFHLATHIWKIPTLMCYYIDKLE